MAFLDTSLVALRESLEALLILGILLGVATKLGQPAARRPLLWGAIAGVVASVLAGILARNVAKSLYESNEQAFEGIASLVAVAILTYMIVWMYRHTQGMIGALTSRTRMALGRPGVLFGIAFVAVFREGIETVLFTATKFATDGVGITVLALLAGIAAATFVAFLIFAGFLRLSIERFMLGTGLLLVVIAAGLLGYGAHELAETGAIPETAKAYDIRDTLPHKGHPGDPDIDTPSEALGSFLFGFVLYRANPTWLEVGLWFAYILGMGGWVVRRLRKHPKPVKPAAESPEVT
jgi:high-affinity iron transporter